jgi:hypothetical protein
MPGPTEEVALAIMEERRLREQEAALQREAEAKLARKVAQQAEALQQRLEKVSP